MVYGLIRVVVFLFYFSFCFLFLVFVITVLLRVKGKKRFKQRCDAWRCRVFPAAFKARIVSNKGTSRISRAASTAGFSLPKNGAFQLRFYQNVLTASSSAATAER